MNFESKTIKYCIDEIEKGNYVMPAIQREFVWGTDQIEQLFDSLMQSFPISSFLFWQVDETNAEEYQFYKFIKYYHEKNNKHNEKYDSFHKKPLTAILDGQQRLTSLYIGLVGSYAYKTPHKRVNDASAYISRKLYFNLLSGHNNLDISNKFEFKFLTEEEASNRKGVWFKVGDILDKEDISQAMQTAFDYCEAREDLSQAQRNLSQLWNVVHQEKAINYHLETTDRLDKVLQIFIRVNSGGTKLSYSDLLLSIATSEWKEKDAREEINNFVDEINDMGFNISKDFILKSCLVLSGFKDIAFKIENFNKPNMKIIEDNWENIKSALRITFQTLKNFGLNNETISSYNALIPIAYFILKNDCPESFPESVRYEQSRESIFKWLVRTSLKQTFSGQPDNVLKPVRDYIKVNDNENFPLVEIVDMLKKSYPNKSISFDYNESFDFILDLKYGKPSTYLVLALLQNGRNPSKIYHQDHIFPKSQFTKNQRNALGLSSDVYDLYLSKKDSIANVQLLEGNVNQSKSKKDFKAWLDNNFDDENYKNAYLAQQQMPLDHSLDFADFLSFIQKREQKMVEQFKKIL